MPLRTPPDPFVVLPEAEARQYLVDWAGSSMILHLESYGNGFAVLGHSVCDWCRLCDPQGDCRGRPDVEAVPWTEDDLYPDPEDEEVPDERGNDC